MRPLLNAPDTRLTTLQAEEEEKSLVNQNFGDDPQRDGESTGKKYVCNVQVSCKPVALLSLFWPIW